MSNYLYTLDNKILQHKGLTVDLVGAFSPNQLPNLRAWYGDYVNGGTLRTTLSDSANINSWDDLSGNAFHIDNVAGTAPTYNASGNFIDFNTASGMLYNNNHSILSGNEALTLFVIAETGDNTKNSSDFICFGKYIKNGNVYIHNNLTTAVSIQNNYGYARSNIIMTNNQKYIFTSAHPNTGSLLTNLIFRWNGNNATINASRDFTNNIITGVYVGGIYFSNNPYYTDRGDLHAYEVILYNRQLSTAEIQTVEAYLNTKYSIY